MGENKRKAKDMKRKMKEDETPNLGAIASLSDVSSSRGAAARSMPRRSGASWSSAVTAAASNSNTVGDIGDVARTISDVESGSEWETEEEAKGDTTELSNVCDEATSLSPPQSARVGTILVHELSAAATYSSILKTKPSTKVTAVTASVDESAQPTAGPYGDKQLGKRKPFRYSLFL